MKKVTLIIISFVVLITLIVVSSIAKDKKEISKVSIDIGNKKTYSTTSKSVIKTSSESENSNIFESIIKNTDLVIPYVKLGQEIKININGATPDTYELYDYILNDSGKLKYEKQTNKISINFIDGQATFILNSNLWANLSSNIEDYEHGKTIRGFKLICSWANKKQEFAFIIRTDANTNSPLQSRGTAISLSP